ncbi:hypothetical protein EJE24_14880 [Enterobacter huaxiensis]|uniref:Uncharacterized protein n=1 Tax=Enterobacter huaxiensis TaxID=2494702 RepID=A0A3R9QN85_9ENTR|nr:hypothetical protein EJE24_14880 [Enterobacter huaxiensis]UNC48854.1 hypothetical protein D5067_0004420 [Enterobacter huaxiensis]
MKKPSIKITFRFYGTAVYFLYNVILVTRIVIICFIFFGKDRREPHQQKGELKGKFPGRDHSKPLTRQIIKRAIIQFMPKNELIRVNISF